jgi:hypothetical protein
MRHEQHRLLAALPSLARRGILRLLPPQCKAQKVISQLRAGGRAHSRDFFLAANQVILPLTVSAKGAHATLTRCPKRGIGIAAFKVWCSRTDRNDRTLDQRQNP